MPVLSDKPKTTPTKDPQIISLKDVSFESLRKIIEEDLEKSYEIQVKTPNPVHLKCSRSDSDIEFSKQYADLKNEFYRCKTPNEQYACSNKVRSLLEQRLSEKGIEYRVIETAAELYDAKAVAQFEHLLNQVCAYPIICSLTIIIRRFCDSFNNNIRLHGSDVTRKMVCPYIQILPSENSKMGRIIKSLQSRYIASGVFLNTNPKEASSVSNEDNHIHFNPTILENIDHLLLPTFASSHLIEELNHLKYNNSPYKEDLALNNCIIRKYLLKKAGGYVNVLYFGELKAKQKVISVLLADPFANNTEISGALEELEKLTSRISMASIEALSNLSIGKMKNIKPCKEQREVGYNKYKVSIGKEYWVVRIDSEIKDPIKISEAVANNFLRMLGDAQGSYAFYYKALQAYEKKEQGNQVHMIKRRA